MGLSQAELGAKIGVSYQTINQWEKNPPKAFSGANMGKLSSALDVSQAWLIEKHPKMGIENVNSAVVDFGKLGTNTEDPMSEITLSLKEYNKMVLENADQKREIEDLRRLLASKTGTESK